jgi:hypothetical protein
MAEVATKPCSSLPLINIVWASEGTPVPDGTTTAKSSAADPGRFLDFSVILRAKRPAATKCILNLARDSGAAITRS